MAQQLTVPMDFDKAKLPEWKQSQRELLRPRRLKALAELVTNLHELDRQRPKPMDRTVTTAGGRVMRYWTDGSLRHG